MSDSAQIEKLLRQFYEHQGTLRGYVFSATRDYHVTEEILQDIAIVVAQKADSFDSGRPALPWLMGIARNHIQRWYQKKGSEAANVSYDVLQNLAPEYSVYKTEQLSLRRLALKHCMQLLPEKQRRILQLRYEEELDCTKVSAVTGRSVQAVYALLKRIKRELRKCVERRLVKLQMQ